MIKITTTLSTSILPFQLVGMGGFNQIRRNGEIPYWHTSYNTTADWDTPYGTDWDKPYTTEIP